MPLTLTHPKVICHGASISLQDLLKCLSACCGMWYALLVKLLRRDLKKRLQGSDGSIVNQQVHGTDIFQGRLRSPPVGKVYAHGSDRGTLEIKDIKYITKGFLIATLLFIQIPLVMR